MPIFGFTPGQQLTAAQLNLITAMLPSAQVATANVASAVPGTLYRVQPSGGGNVNITLPAPTLGAVIAVKLDAASGTATIAHNATETIYGPDTWQPATQTRGATSVTISQPDAVVVVQADGVNWQEYGTLVTLPWKFYDVTAGAGGASAFTIPGSGSLPTGFSTIVIDLMARVGTAAATDGLLMRFNADTNTNYYNQATDSAAAGTSASTVIAGTAFTVGSLPAASAPAGALDHWRIVIPNYTNASTVQSWSAFGGTMAALTSGNVHNTTSHGVYYHAAALSSITLFPATSSQSFTQFSRCVVTLFP